MNILNDEQLVKVFNPSKFHPYLYRLSSIDWYIFGSLTWDGDNRRKDTPLAEKYRKRDFNDLLGAFCGQFKIRRKNLPFYKATEFGESGEAHSHFLIAKNGCGHLPML
jgi:hypothetical protein